MNAFELARQFQATVLQPLKNTFVAKEEIVDLMGVAMAAGENLFLFGPPGTAKSALVHELGHLLQCRSFEYLLTRFTEPNELFGPFDIRRLREGDLVTNTEGMLPEAELVFLDELLNANSAILNSLLMTLNERVFRRGRETRALPALMFVGASNHLPEEEALRALFDRFLLRAWCVNVPESQLSEVLEAGWKFDNRLEKLKSTLSIEEIRSMQRAVRQIDLTDIKEDYVQTIRRLRAAGLAVSDRRAIKLQRVIAASALLSGRDRARPSDLWVLRHIWDSEEQREWLAAFMDEVLRAWEPRADDHPRAHRSAPPNVEAMAAELDSLMAGIATLPPEMLKDKLVTLGHRIEWIEDAVPRDDMRARWKTAWEKVE